MYLIIQYELIIKTPKIAFILIFKNRFLNIIMIQSSSVLSFCKINEEFGLVIEKNTVQIINKK